MASQDKQNPPVIPNFDAKLLLLQQQNMDELAEM